MAWCPPVSLHEMQQELCSTPPNGILKTDLKCLYSLWLFDLQWASLSLAVCLGLTGSVQRLPAHVDAQHAHLHCAVLGRTI